jgi:hypothetical protein
MVLFADWFTVFKSTLMIQKRDSRYKFLQIFRSLVGQHFQFSWLNEISDILCFHLYAARALELFLQDLIDRTYEITLQSGAKTLNSFHL